MTVLEPTPTRGFFWIRGSCAAVLIQGQTSPCPVIHLKAWPIEQELISGRCAPSAPEAGVVRHCQELVARRRDLIRGDDADDCRGPGRYSVTCATDDGLCLAIQWHTESVIRFSMPALAPRWTTYMAGREAKPVARCGFEWPP